ncbi:unnamed protein product [Rangifer tarandus platyrhynchus]|uniref:Uncharacterized protein n=2 Tax=Rangifer tarandus platyrhynchus TaxID=3082113 RepID=A0ABN8ZCU6_RANTA|nr:unnamed protein product [Rangifer tarandus platyrhynchus]CAI9707851.1 unnamed protein product [Rangifer tarandus platyrhynchus]
MGARARAPPGLPKRSCRAAPGGLGQSPGPSLRQRFLSPRPGCGLPWARGPPDDRRGSPPPPLSPPPRPALTSRGCARAPAAWGPGSAAPPGREGGGGRRAEPGECRLSARSPGNAPPEHAREVRLCRAAWPGEGGDLASSRRGPSSVGRPRRAHLERSNAVPG